MVQDDTVAEVRTVPHVKNGRSGRVIHIDPRNVEVISSVPSCPESQVTNVSPDTPIGFLPGERGLPATGQAGGAVRIDEGVEDHA